MVVKDYINLLNLIYFDARLGYLVNLSIVHSNLCSYGKILFCGEINLMAMIIITWDNPSDEDKVKAMEEKAKDWRTTVLQQDGLKSFSSFVHPFALSQSMVSESFASVDDANQYMSSPQWAQIVSEMGSMGATNIKADLWKPSKDVPVALRP